MVKLINYTEYLSRGAILKCKGKYLYEDTLYFMVAEQIGVQAYQLWTISGYYAGMILHKLPSDANYETYAVSTKWLVGNWHEWGYIDCPLEDVWVVENEELFSNLNIKMLNSSY